jgi:GTPase involved in cell partitioning and DNA repair
MISKKSADLIYKKLDRIDHELQYFRYDIFEKKKIIIKNFYNTEYSLNNDLTSNQLVKKLISCQNDFEKLQKIIYNIMFDIPEIEQAYLKANPEVEPNKK